MESRHLLSKASLPLLFSLVKTRDSFSNEVPIIYSTQAMTIFRALCFKNKELLMITISHESKLQKFLAIATRSGGIIYYYSLNF